MEKRIEEPDTEELATHGGPEPCVDVSEDIGEALTGARARTTWRAAPPQADVANAWRSAPPGSSTPRRSIRERPRASRAEARRSPTRRCEGAFLPPRLPARTSPASSAPPSPIAFQTLDRGAWITTSFSMRSLLDIGHRPGGHRSRGSRYATAHRMPSRPRRRPARQDDEPRGPVGQDRCAVAPESGRRL